MKSFTYFDVLAECDLAITPEGAATSPASDASERPPCSSLFFPGCALVNFGAVVTDKVYRDLKDRGIVDGISLLCCGKILAFEDETGLIQQDHRLRLLKALEAKGIKRIVTACPNCFDELNDMFAAAGDTSSVEVTALPQVLHEEGFAIAQDAVVSVLATTNEPPIAPAIPKIAMHDSCPDRTIGVFAENVRALFPHDNLVELEHNRKDSRCCGSLARAAGRPDVMESQAQQRGIEGTAAHADSLVTACMSCANILGRFQTAIAVHHYLEFLYATPIDWPNSPTYMEFRLLFEELHGKRDYLGL